MATVTEKSAARRGERPSKTPRRDRNDWLIAARQALIEGGVERVKVEPLAGQLGVTTGSFYHHFKNRQELLDGLLQHWETTNSAPWFDAVEHAAPGPDAKIDALFGVWQLENEYDPHYDSAVRDWARISKSAEAAVRRVDTQRTELLQQIYIEFGYDPDRALIRARITYFHQVGYQAMAIIETREERRAFLPLYREVLVGVPPR